MTDTDIEALTELGFTRLEAEVYVFLLQHAPATGYRIAKGVGRTNANTYKAIESLAAKGAIEVDEGARRRCRAVPAEELLAQLGRRFERTRQRAREALERLEPAAGDDRIYHLKSRPQVLERARAMLERASYVTVVDIYPVLIDELRGAIEATAARGVKVTLKTYQPVRLGGATVVHRRKGHEIIHRTPYDHLSLNIDGREHLATSLRRDGRPLPYYAIWTASASLAYNFYNGMIHELILTDLRQAVWDGVDGAGLRAVLDRHAYLHPITTQNPVYQAHVEAIEAPGNDRDGNPMVTDGVTQDALATYRRASLRRVHQRLQDVLHALSIAAHSIDVPPVFAVRPVTPPR